MYVHVCSRIVIISRPESPKITIALIYEVVILIYIRIIPDNVRTKLRKGKGIDKSPQEA